MNTIEKMLGDYQSFFSELLTNLNKVGISIANLPISHFLFRTKTMSEYEMIRDALKTHCREFVETQFNGRAISILILKHSLSLQEGFIVQTIELPAPRLTQNEKAGWESIGVVMGDQLSSFIEIHRNQLTGIKEDNTQAHVTFDTGKTVKFYNMSIKEKVLAQGWIMETLV